MAIRPFLNGETFDPETARLVGVAFETARAAVNRPADLSDEMIARTIIERAKAGERNVEVLCEAALNVPAGAVSPPILLRFPLNCRSRQVLHLEPIRRAPRAIRRVLPLRHDAFESHLAGVGEDGRAVAFQMLVEAQAKASFGQRTSKRGLADLKRIAPQVVAVQLDQVEGV